MQAIGEDTSILDNEEGKPRFLFTILLWRQGRHLHVFALSMASVHYIQ